MKIGMLWFDDDREAALGTRVERAVSYYQNKYGLLPNVCVFHPTTLADGKSRDIHGVRLEQSRSVLPNHFWLGIEEKSTGG